jgi:pyruvate kinase
LKEGDDLVLTTETIMGDERRLSISYKQLPEEISVGDHILLDDGLISLEVKSIGGTEIFCKVQNGGSIKSRRGVNVPGKKLNMEFLSQKDKEDILFGIKNDIDFIALSFVRDKSEVKQVRELLKENESPIHLIAKIENTFAVENIKSIIKVSDGIMVARGDLGVEIPIE